MLENKSSIAKVLGNHIYSNGLSFQIATICLNWISFFVGPKEFRCIFVGMGRLATLLEKNSSDTNDPLFAEWDVENSMVMT